MGAKAWTAQTEWDDSARWSQACYVLRNIADWGAEDLWRTDIQLPDAEAAFRIQKSERGIRPVWHQRAGLADPHRYAPRCRPDQHLGSARG
jgi:hypothetical protein